MPASDSHNPSVARAREEALRVFYRMLDLDDAHVEDAARAAIASAAMSYEAEVARVRELEAENACLREALSTAADDLDKAANQFEAIRQAQKAGHEVQVVSNSRVFAAKAQRAREALEAGER